MRTTTSSSSLVLFFVTIFVLGTLMNVCNAGGHHGKFKNIRHGDHGRAGAPKKNHGRADLKMNFYKEICPDVEELVRNITWDIAKDDPFLGAKLLRIHYHDCFVRGCDASLLLDPTSKETINKVEKEARPNLSLLGYEVIDEIKAQLEKQCPETVSCADIVALAARDAVSFQYQRDMWKVQTGRRDGRVSLESEVPNNLPSASSNFTTLQQLFDRKGLDVDDLVALSGAHTIGIARCGVISRRLFNFTGKGDTDPSLDPSYATILKKQCSNTRNIVEMDPKSSVSFDSHYFKNLNQHKGLFQSDASLLTNSYSARLVRQLQNGNKFFFEFAKSMKKMGAMEVLTGNDGEIRKQCRIIN